jgi:CheY-like chemotaxis protein
MSARVLLVDAEAAVRRQLGSALAERGFETADAPDGLAALVALGNAAAEGRPFHGLVVDAALPDVDGLKLLSLAKARFPGVKVLVTANGPDASMAEQVAQRQGDAFLVKPVEADDVAGRFAGAGGAPAEASAGPALPAAGATAHVLFRAERSADPWSTRRCLCGGPNVVDCDPVRDARWDLVMRMQAGSQDEVRSSVKVCAGDERFDAVEVIPSTPPVLPAGLRAFLDHDGRGAEARVRRPDRATSYLLVDVHPGGLADLYVRLSLLDETVRIDADEAGNRLVLLLQGTDFDRLRHVVNDRIRWLDGVVRLHEMKVVAVEEG